MAPPPSKKQTVRHFTDPKHPLHLVTISDEFQCNGCRELGSGTRFRCKACDVNLHEFCATCPATIRSSVLQIKYPLTLVNERPATERICDICRDPVKGLHYSCPPCAVEVHPLCTQSPLHARLSQHPEHIMKTPADEVDMQTTSGSERIKKRYIFGILANVALAAATTAVIGVPLTYC
ncbi:PREDICTED: uncharacterized protein LOC105960303 [Erythranthe guttata]|uniref:uncharacterized protein LOC105960303 n=1 Tax=Erythranthe guttata TaxID=4155 RepID=UPI00064DEBC8|nr:PREDICTED: uncharacterized protein LOC105960303 [Erythranthe guttata]|eukprot:XP_012839922.1 PREDICTED: uncharacterized protein LOC105960303 [Erythranthe guttata]